MQQYEPWADSHAPCNFERTDKSARYQPLVTHIPDIETMFMVGASCVMAVALIVLWLIF